jgi:hypothetical protein
MRTTSNACPTLHLPFEAVQWLQLGFPFLRHRLHLAESATFASRAYTRHAAGHHVSATNTRNHKSKWTSDVVEVPTKLVILYVITILTRKLNC